MADFEEKLNAILSSPESMRQVAQLAQMLSARKTRPRLPPVKRPRHRLRRPHSSLRRTTEAPCRICLRCWMDWI